MADVALYLNCPVCGGHTATITLDTNGDLLVRFAKEGVTHVQCGATGEQWAGEFNRAMTSLLDEAVAMMRASDEGMPCD